jgi:hypothetical protein
VVVAVLCGCPPQTNGFVRCSTDGGMTWTEPSFALIPPGHEGAGADPALAFDAEGRLYWAHLSAVFDDLGVPQEIDVVVARIDPVTGDYVTGPHLVTNAAAAGNGVQNDKEWIAVDSNPQSPFAGRLYVVWTVFNADGTRVRLKWSADQGQSWSSPVNISPAPSLSQEGFLWPAHVAVARNGDVYVAYHSQPTFTGSVPDGQSGQVFVRRSTDGGVSFPQKTLAFGPGEADITFNLQDLDGTIPGTTFWTQGSAQPWVVPDPVVPGRVYVFAADDPDDLHGIGDEADLMMSVSEDHGATWAPPVTVEAGPGGSFQLFPTACVDPATGVLAAGWYDNRVGAVNGSGNWLIDWFASTSTDGGATWSAPGLVNDAPVDPDLATGTVSISPSTLRIGEYGGIALADGARHSIWTGNDATDTQTLSDSLPGAVASSPWADLGEALAGGSGSPSLQGLGQLEPGSPVILALGDALAGSTTTLLIGASVLGAPFKGGVLVPSPDRLFAALPVDGGGRLELAATWPAGVPSGMALTFQHWITDASGPLGFTASNAVSGTAP